MKNNCIRAWLVLLLAGLALGLFATVRVCAERRDARRQSEVTYPAQVTSSLVRICNGAFPVWCAANDLITYTDMVGDRYEVFVMKPDGTGVRRLTAGKQALAGCGHRGQSSWHPSGRYIVFTAENAHFDRRGFGGTARPGIGRNHDVWIMTSDGTRFWKVTDYPDNWGSIRASFSHDGGKLYWNEEWSMEKYPGEGAYWGRSNITRPGEELGLWRIKMADISFDSNGPVLTNIRIVPLPSQLALIEGEGLSPDDRRTVFSACPLDENGGRGLWGDIYTMNLDGSGLTRLTNTPRRHDENGTYSPDGCRIAWNAAGGDPGTGEELFLMNVDGTNKSRLTWFTDTGHPEYDPNARQITELSWSPDGRRIVFGHASRERLRGATELGSSLWVITLGDSGVESVNAARQANSVAMAESWKESFAVDGQ